MAAGLESIGRFLRNGDGIEAAARETACESDLPDDYGEDEDISDLPDDYGEDEDSSELPDDKGTEEPASDLPDGSGSETERPKDADEQKDIFLAKLEQLLTPEGIQALAEKYPEKFRAIQEAIDTLNNPDAAPAEKAAAKDRLDKAKGSVLELATKEALAESGLTVEDKQRTVEGADGKTRPDVIAKNNTDHPITVLGITVNPGESISIECKCGVKDSLSSQLSSHIPNQLSGHVGHSVLLTTSDIKEISPERVKQVCSRYGSTLVTVGQTATEVGNAMKGVKI